MISLGGQWFHNSLFNLFVQHITVLSLTNITDLVLDVPDCL